MALRFDLCDLVMLHKIIHVNMPINLPTYLSFFTGNSRLRFCHLDTMSLVSSVVPTGSNNALTNSFFYRSHLLWNKLPIEIRSISSNISFKSSLKRHLFDSMSVSLSDCTDESECELWEVFFFLHIISCHIIHYFIFSFRNLCIPFSPYLLY